MANAQFRPPTAETWADPWPMYRALRDHDPVHHVVPDGNSSADYYVLSRHADIWSAACDDETFAPNPDPARDINHDELKSLGLQDNSPTWRHDPRTYHSEFRKLVSRGFATRQVELKVRGFVVERIERLRANGGGDIVAELFEPLPAMVVADYLGVPEADRGLFDGWTRAIVAANLADADFANGVKPAVAAFTTMMVYFIELIKLRRRVPGQDAISELVAAGVGVDGDIVGMLSVLAFVFTTIASGIDTTTGMLGGSMQLLHQRPDQRRLLVENPEHIPASLDEFLRLTSPVQGKGRTVTRDVTIGDVTVPEGCRVLFLYGSANRDERQYGPDAGELNVLRQPRNILTFGHGGHRCLGVSAVRMQSRVAFAELLSRCPDFEIDESAIVWAGGSLVRRPLSVPFRAGS
ncbi:cytochrome [Mycobacterium malmoense]|uniref:Cytochrome n=2 Tax=Mycobacterium malmoense TaxID=1780 RepID=A0ABX3SKB7_MYCMA|nr:cytochrome [Mycobacterium malmoense]